MSGPKILALDIENSFVLAGVWGLWQQNVNTDLILDSGKVMCFAARWIGSKKMEFARYDKPLFLESIHALLDEADAVLTYNGRRHDVPLLNREFLKAGMKPPSPYKQIDLFETAKKAFKFPSNKLAQISKELGIGSKLDHGGFQLWVQCLEGNEDAWRIMEKYNKQDVVLLEKLYKKLLPWVSTHPNHSLYGDRSRPVCPSCGSAHLHARGVYRTQTALYQRYQCQNKACGAWSRSRFTEVAKEQRVSVLTQAAG